MPIDSFLPENDTLPSPLPPPAPREEYRSDDDDVPVAPPAAAAAADAAAEDCAVSECRDPSSLSPSLPICGFS